LNIKRFGSQENARWKGVEKSAYTFVTHEKGGASADKIGREEEKNPPGNGLD
jgi:hypothetical protein